MDSLGPPLRQKCLSVLYKICDRQALLPTSLQIPLCYDPSDVPLYIGGFADVWKGEHQGANVAVKVLKVTSGNLDKVRNVGHRTNPSNSGGAHYACRDSARK